MKKFLLLLAAVGMVFTACEMGGGDDDINAPNEQPGGEGGGNIDVGTPNNTIYYTSTDGAVVTPNAVDDFGANIVSNTCEDGKGIITFDGNVTQIGRASFQNCTSLESVTIPDSVTSIGEYAFYDCPSLTSITIPDSVTSIGKSAFGRCTSLTSVTIPDSVTVIRSSPFFRCTSLKAFYGKFASSDNRCLIVDGVLNSFALGCGATEYTIPDSVTLIERQAFAWCPSLTSVTIPDSVTSIGDYAFNRCSSLTSVSIGSGVTLIGEWTFGHCPSLKSVTIPDSVTSIGSYAFCECTSLKEVYCKATTPPTGESYMFDNNATGRTIYVPAASVYAYKTAQYWSDYASDIVGYDFEKGEVVKPATKPANNEIWYTSTDGKAVTPHNSGVNVFGANIVSNTYSNGKGVIKFDGNVTSIGDRAFGSCTSLTSVAIGNSVTSIGEYAFYDCPSLTSITIPDSVTSIGKSAFYDCPSLTRVDIADLSAWCKIDFGASSANPLYNNRGNLYIDGVEATNITIPSDITEIKQYAFYGCNSLTITIPDSVTSIGRTAFFNCNVLTGIKIPDSVVEIGAHAFASCRKLEYFYGKFASNDNRCLIVDNILNSYAGGAKVTSYEIPSNITAIDAYAFQDNDYLKSVTIHDGVTYIGTQAFYHCSALKSVYCKSATPPTGGKRMFSYTKNDIEYPLGCTIYVPAASVETYKTAQYWSDYASDIVGYDF